MNKDLKRTDTNTSYLATEELRRPGKGTLVTSVMPHPCEGMSGPICTLSPPERDDTRLELVQRIAAAGAAYGDACVELRIGRLLDKEHPSHLLGILLEIIGMRAIAGAVSALKALKTASKLPISEKIIEQGVKMSVDLAKKRALGVPSPDPDNIRPYLARLGELGAIALQDLTHRVLAYGTDEELLAYHQGFDAPNHTVAIYLTALEKQVKKFEQSGVLNIGDRTASRAPLPPVNRETKAIWLVYPDGRRELALASEDCQMGLAHHGPEVADSTRVRVLEPEFVEAALTAHAKAHHLPPREVPTAGVPTMQLRDVP